MSERNWKLFIKDIHIAAEKILLFTKGLDMDQLEQDEKTFDAVMRNLEIIGEAVKNIPDEVKNEKSISRIE